MNDPDETLKSEEPLPQRSGGPFSVEPVDPLVYRQTNDSPEMRAAAAYIPVANRRLRIRDPKPVKPEERDHDQWTPGAKTTQPTDDGTINARTRVRGIGMKVLTVLLIVVPVALIVAAVVVGASLANI